MRSLQFDGLMVPLSLFQGETAVLSGGNASGNGFGLAFGQGVAGGDGLGLAQIEGGSFVTNATDNQTSTVGITTGGLDLNGTAAVTGIGQGSQVSAVGGSQGAINGQFQGDFFQGEFVFTNFSMVPGNNSTKKKKKSKQDQVAVFNSYLVNVGNGTSAASSGSELFTNGNAFLNGVNGTIGIGIAQGAGAGLAGTGSNVDANSNGVFSNSNGLTNLFGASNGFVAGIGVMQGVGQSTGSLGLLTGGAGFSQQIEPPAGLATP